MKDLIKSYNEIIFEDVLLEGKYEALSKWKDIESELNEFYLPSREGLDPQVERFEDRIVITDECQICTYLIKELNF